jgi:hypothetical protein
VATAIATLFGVWWWRHRSKHVRIIGANTYG